MCTNERFRISETDDETSTLSIRVTELSDRGVYTALAVNSVGEVEAKIMLNIIAVKPILVRDLLSTVQIMKGESMSLQFTISGLPLPEVIWMKNNNELIPNENIQITVSIADDNNIYTLTILNVQPNDQGEYFAKISNIVGSIESKRCSVRVKSKYIFSHGKHDVFLFRIPDISYQTRITGS